MSLKAHNKGSLRDICHRGTFIVSFERHLPQRHLYCEFRETSATEAPLLWALGDICHRGTLNSQWRFLCCRCLSKLTIKVPLWQMSYKTHNKGSSVWVLGDICHRGTFIVSSRRHLPQRNLYCEFVRHLPQRNLQMSLKAHNKGSSVADVYQSSQ
jgi:hypothetical protein